MPMAVSKILPNDRPTPNASNLYNLAKFLELYIACAFNKLEGQALAGSNYCTLLTQTIEHDGHFELVARRDPVRYDVRNVRIKWRGGVEDRER
jgi:hypothetical protein